MKTRIASEIISFLGNNRISARGLAREAGVPASTILRITSGIGGDMSSSNADKVRDAMLRFTAIPTKPPESKPHEGDGDAA